MIIFCFLAAFILNRFWTNRRLDRCRWLLRCVCVQSSVPSGRGRVFVAAFFRSTLTREDEEKKIKGKGKRENCPHACLNSSTKSSSKHRCLLLPELFPFISTSRALKSTVTILLLRYRCYINIYIYIYMQNRGQNRLNIYIYIHICVAILCCPLGTEGEKRCYFSAGFFEDKTDLRVKKKL